jgi:hypothetical protein
MQKKSTITILFVFFILLSLVSILFLYSAHTTPIEETLVTASYAYEYEGTYDYTVALKPNTIYDNNATLKPGEGTIYRRITDHIDVNFTYFFSGDQTANFTISYVTHEYVETASWDKQIAEFPKEVIKSSGDTINFSVINIPAIFPSSILQIVNEINADTGIITGDYSLNITIEMRIEAETSAGSVDESFAPSLKADFKVTPDQGETISITGLEYTKTGSKTKTEEIYQPWVEQQRNIYYGFSTVSFFGLAVSVWFYTKNRPTKPLEAQKLIDEIIEPYEEIIVEAGQEQLSKPATTISTKTLEDLVKVADTTGKPIIHTFEAPDVHVFSIIDGDTQYKFSTTISIEQKRKEVIEEEEDE